MMEIGVDLGKDSGMEEMVVVICNKEFAERDQGKHDRVKTTYSR
jgi:hypothetical protein